MTFREPGHIPRRVELLVTYSECRRKHPNLPGADVIRQACNLTGASWREMRIALLAQANKVRKGREKANG